MLIKGVFSTSIAYQLEIPRRVVLVAREPQLSTRLGSFAADFGIRPMRLSAWLKRPALTTVSELVSPLVKLRSFVTVVSLFAG